VGLVEDERERRGAKHILSEPRSQGLNRSAAAGLDLVSYSDLRGRERKLKVHIPSSPIGGSIGSELNA
jgi:hypothetical protein